MRSSAVAASGKRTIMSERARPKPEDAIAVAVAGGGGAAPLVTASGRGEFANTLLSIAFANGVPVREDADLAQVLSAIEIETPVPVAAFAAVAEILSYVYRANLDPRA